MARKYVPTPKHAGPSGAVGIKGTPIGLADAAAQALLNDNAHCFEEPGKKQFIAAKDKKCYAFQPDNAGGYHGYRISGNECCAKYPKSAAKIAAILGVDFKRLQKLP